MPVVKRSGRTNSQRQKKHVNLTPGEWEPVCPQQGVWTPRRRGLSGGPEAPSPSEPCVHMTLFGERLCGDVIKFRMIIPDYIDTYCLRP